MVRTIPASRFPALVDAATRIFIAQGYRRTQMSDIASAMSLGKGTLYGYVESKAALFRFTLEHCDASKPIEPPAVLPIPTPPPGDTLAFFQEKMAKDGTVPRLASALERDAPPVASGGISGEIEGIFSELYGLLYANHHGIRLMEACALDHPELADHWHHDGRYAYVELLARYLERRCASGAITLVADSSAVARFIVEAITTWAVHIHFDPSPQALSREVTEPMVMHFLRSGLLRCEGS
jgi:AcrR family transcriptional regulator